MALSIAQIAANIKAAFKLNYDVNFLPPDQVAQSIAQNGVSASSAASTAAANAAANAGGGGGNLMNSVTPLMQAPQMISQAKNMIAGNKPPTTPSPFGLDSHGNVTQRLQDGSVLQTRPSTGSVPTQTNGSSSFVPSGSSGGHTYYSPSSGSVSSTPLVNSSQLPPLQSGYTYGQYNGQLAISNGNKVWTVTDADLSRTKFTGETFTPGTGTDAAGNLYMSDVYGKNLQPIPQGFINSGNSSSVVVYNKSGLPQPSSTPDGLGGPSYETNNGSIDTSGPLWDKFKPTNPVVTVQSPPSIMTGQPASTMSQPANTFLPSSAAAGATANGPHYEIVAGKVVQMPGVLPTYHMDPLTKTWVGDNPGEAPFLPTSNEVYSWQYAGGQIHPVIRPGMEGYANQVATPPVSVDNNGNYFVTNEDGTITTVNPNKDINPTVLTSENAELTEEKYQLDQSGKTGNFFQRIWNNPKLKFGITGITAAVSMYGLYTGFQSLVQKFTVGSATQIGISAISGYFSLHSFLSSSVLGHSRLLSDPRLAMAIMAAIAIAAVLTALFGGMTEAEKANQALDDTLDTTPISVYTSGSVMAMTAGIAAMATVGIGLGPDFAASQSIMVPTAQLTTALGQSGLANFSTGNAAGSLSNLNGATFLSQGTGANGQDQVMYVTQNSNGTSTVSVSTLGKDLKFAKSTRPDGAYIPMYITVNGHLQPNPDATTALNAQRHGAAAANGASDPTTTQTAVANASAANKK